MTPFPWRDAIGFGFGVLRLSPEAFWTMTPRELAYAFAVHFGGAPQAMPRTALNALMQRFPDRTERTDG